MVRYARKSWHAGMALDLCWRACRLGHRLSWSFIVRTFRYMLCSKAGLMMAAWAAETCSHTWFNFISAYCWNCCVWTKIYIRFDLSWFTSDPDTSRHEAGSISSLINNRTVRRHVIESVIKYTTESNSEQVEHNATYNLVFIYFFLIQINKSSNVRVM